MTEIEFQDSVDPQTIGQLDKSANVGSEGLRQRPRSLVPPMEVDEDDYGIQYNYSEQELLDDGGARWALYTVVFCALDLIGSGVILCTSFKYAYFDGAVSLYSLGLQAVSHWFSSLLLTLKFSNELGAIKEAQAGARDTHSMLLQRRRKQLFREQGISIFMACTLLMSAVALLFKAFRKLRFWKVWYANTLRSTMEEEMQAVTRWLAWTGFAIYVVQAVFRFLAARKLKNCLVTHGCVASIVSLVYLMVLAIAASYEKEWTWKAEPIAAICLVVVMLIEGVRITIYYLDDMDARLVDSSRA